jgi:hypothetical protein
MRFLTLHYAYFIGTCLISSFILWGAAQPFGSLRYIDALYLAISAMTLAGLNTVNLSTLSNFQQLWLFFLIILGSAVSSRTYSLLHQTVRECQPTPVVDLGVHRRPLDAQARIRTAVR